MSQQYDNELRGALFKNTRRREGKNDPQAQGSCTINGVEYWVDAWTDKVKKGPREGEPYQSLKFRPKENQPAAADPIDDDEIPF